jgi:hypothetical protein
MQINVTIVASTATVVAVMMDQLAFGLVQTIPIGVTHMLVALLRVSI